VRLLIRLRADRDASYDHAYHHKLRGRLWRALEGSEFDDLHDADHPIGLCFSNPFPPKNMGEGDRRTVLVASPNDRLLATIAEDIVADREFNIGEMPFSVEEVVGIDPDVGEPGSHGVIESGTGTVVRIPPWRFEEYEIDIESNQGAFWRPEFTMEPFVNQIENNLDQKHDHFCQEFLPGPSETDGDLFDSFELIKTYALPVTVTQGEEITHIVSKWRFRYSVRSDDHRRHLNLALDTGIGERNALGFGFLNIAESSSPANDAPMPETVGGVDT
jgi:CRISPR-associated endoribonuclease Cas6